MRADYTRANPETVQVINRLTILSGEPVTLLEKCQVSPTSSENLQLTRQISASNKQEELKCFSC